MSLGYDRINLFGMTYILLARIEGFDRIGAEYPASLKYIQLQTRNLSGIYNVVDRIVRQNQVLCRILHKI